MTAAPRFLDLQGDARKASLQGLKGAMQGAAGIVYGKAVIEGIENEPSGTVSSGTGTIATAYGFPEATSAGIGSAVSGLNDDWSVVSVASPSISYTFSGRDGATCNVQYTQPDAAGNEPQIQVDASGC